MPACCCCKGCIHRRHRRSCFWTRSKNRNCSRAPPKKRGLSKYQVARKEDNLSYCMQLPLVMQKAHVVHLWEFCQEFYHDVRKRSSGLRQPKTAILLGCSNRHFHQTVCVILLGPVLGLKKGPKSGTLNALSGISCFFVYIRLVEF